MFTLSCFVFVWFGLILFGFCPVWVLSNTPNINDDNQHVKLGPVSDPNLGLGQGLGLS